MSAGTGKVSTLPSLLAISALSAGAGFYAQKHHLPRLAAPLPPLAVYAAVFAASFLLLSFLNRHVRISWKPQGLERARGLAPRVARAMLVCLVFSAPLLLLLDESAAKKTPSLQALLLQDVKPAAGETGYKKDDRQQLENLISGEGQHEKTP
jgi:hypothetical protein